MFSDKIVGKYSLIKSVIIFALLCIFCQVYASDDQYVLKYWGNNDLFKQQLVNFAKQAYRDSYQGFFTEQELDTLFPDDYFSPQPDRTFVVLVNSNKIVGYAKLCFEDKLQVKLDKLYVSKQNQNMGLGKSLLNICMNEAINKKYVHISLLVWTKNPRAIKFYLQNGFNLNAPQRYYRQDGTPTDDYDYEMTGNLNNISQNISDEPIKSCDEKSLEICVLKISIL